LQLCIGEGKIRRYGVKPADRLRITPGNALFCKAVVAQPRFDVLRPTIEGEEVEEIVQVTNGVDQRGAQLPEHHVERQERQRNESTSPVVNAEFLSLWHMVQKRIAWYISVVEEILLAPLR